MEQNMLHYVCTLSAPLFIFNIQSVSLIFFFLAHIIIYFNLFNI